jgi:hypothetical protein
MACQEEPRAEVSDLLADRIATLNYPNFKASVTEDRLHDLYGAFSKGCTWPRRPDRRSRSNGWC